jgi:hypothetical protein
MHNRSSGAVELQENPQSAQPSLHGRSTHHLEDIRAKLGDLKKLERLLAKTVARCSGKTAPDCPVLDILDIQRSK